MALAWFGLAPVWIRDEQCLDDHGVACLPFTGMAVRA